jgi:hypothetical protein
MLGSAKMLRDTGKPGRGSGRWHVARRHDDAPSVTWRRPVRAAFLNAIDAARHRSAELAQGGDEEE